MTIDIGQRSDRLMLGGKGRLKTLYPDIPMPVDECKSLVLLGVLEREGFEKGRLARAGFPMA